MGSDGSFCFIHKCPGPHIKFIVVVDGEFWNWTQGKVKWLPLFNQSLWSPPEEGQWWEGPTPPELRESKTNTLSVSSGNQSQSNPSQTSQDGQGSPTPWKQLGLLGSPDTQLAGSQSPRLWESSAKRYSEQGSPSWCFKCQGYPQNQPGHWCKGTVSCLQRKMSKGRAVLRYKVPICSRTVPESELMHTHVCEECACMHVCVNVHIHCASVNVCVCVHVCMSVYLHAWVCLSFSVSRPDLPNLPGDFYMKSVLPRQPNHKIPLWAWLFSNTLAKPKWLRSRFLIISRHTLEVFYGISFSHAWGPSGPVGSYVCDVAGRQAWGTCQRPSQSFCPLNLGPGPSAVQGKQHLSPWQWCMSESTHMHIFRWKCSQILIVWLLDWN